MHPVILRTARLELSVPTEADVDAIYAACQAKDIQRYTTVPSPYERRHAEGYVAQIPKDWAAGENLTWGIHQSGRMIGTIGLYRVADGMGELGYWMAPSFRGGGRLREAAAAVIDWGFAQEGLDLVRISWRAVAGNVGSARVARGLGFRYEGTMRQSLVNGHGRDDGWIAGLLRTDDRTPQPWPVLED